MEWQPWTGGASGGSGVSVWSAVPGLWQSVLYPLMPVLSVPRLVLLSSLTEAPRPDEPSFCNVKQTEHEGDLPGPVPGVLNSYNPCVLALAYLRLGLLKKTAWTVCHFGHI